MAVYKDKKRGTWYTSFPYVDWTGETLSKTKTWIFDEKRSTELGKSFQTSKGK